MVCQQLFQPMRSAAKGKMFPIPVVDENFAFENIYIWKAREEIDLMNSQNCLFPSTSFSTYLYIELMTFLHVGSENVSQLRKYTKGMLSSFQNIFPTIFSRQSNY